MPGSGDWTKRFAAGESWQPRADWLNNVTRSAQGYLRSRGGDSSDPVAIDLPDGVILVKNDSGANVDCFAILGLNGIITEPSQNLEEFKARQVFDGDTPSAGDTFVICADPIPKGDIGWAFISGVTPCKINIASTDDGFADLIDGDSKQLKSGRSGSARILWSEAGTGTKWAIVQLIGTTALDIFPVNLTVDGGDDGDATTPPSYTYTADDGTDTLGSGLSPDIGRQIGSFAAAIEGDGYVGDDGNFVLYSADEKENVVVCGT